MTNDEIMTLEGDALDCAVAVAHGWSEVLETLTSYKVWSYNVELWSRYHPSTNGKQLLEIIEREKISVLPCAPDLWESEKAIRTETGDNFFMAHGKTIGEAVLRCYLLSKQWGNNG